MWCRSVPECNLFHWPKQSEKKEKKWDYPKLCVISDPVKAARCETLTSAKSFSSVSAPCSPPLYSAPDSWVNLNQRRCDEPQSEAYSNDFHRAGKTGQSLYGGGCLRGRRAPIEVEESKNRNLRRFWLAGSSLVEFFLFSYSQKRRVFLLESWDREGVRFPPGMWLCVPLSWSQWLKNEEFVRV